jgi:hypothetical protein
MEGNPHSLRFYGRPPQLDSTAIPIWASSSVMPTARLDVSFESASVRTAGEESQDGDVPHYPTKEELGDYKARQRR